MNALDCPPLKHVHVIVSSPTAQIIRVFLHHCIIFVPIKIKCKKNRLSFACLVHVVLRPSHREIPEEDKISQTKFWCNNKQLLPKWFQRLCFKKPMITKAQHHIPLLSGNQGHTASLTGPIKNLFNHYLPSCFGTLSVHKEYSASWHLAYEMSTYKLWVLWLWFTKGFHALWYYSVELWHLATVKKSSGCYFWSVL